MRSLAPLVAVAAAVVTAVTPLRAQDIPSQSYIVSFSNVASTYTPLDMLRVQADIDAQIQAISYGLSRPTWGPVLTALLDIPGTCDLGQVYPAIVRYVLANGLPRVGGPREDWFLPPNIPSTKGTGTFSCAGSATAPPRAMIGALVSATHEYRHTLGFWDGYSLDFRGGIYSWDDRRDRYGDPGTLMGGGGGRDEIGFNRWMAGWLSIAIADLAGATYLVEPLTNPVGDRLFLLPALGELGGFGAPAYGLLEYVPGRGVAVHANAGGFTYVVDLDPADGRVFFLRAGQSVNVMGWRVAVTAELVTGALVAIDTPGASVNPPTAAVPTCTTKGCTTTTPPPTGTKTTTTTTTSTGGTK